MTAPSAPPPASGCGPTPGLQTLDSQALLGAAKAVLIAHQGVLYKLQITRQGGLLLTKN